MPIHNSRLEKQVKFRVLPEPISDKAVSLPTSVKSPRRHQDNIRREKVAKKIEKQTANGLTSCLIASSPDLRIGGGIKILKINFYDFQTN